MSNAIGYYQLLVLLEKFEAVETIRLRIAAADEDRFKPAREALAELQAKLEISN